MTQWGIDYASVDGNSPPRWPDLIHAGCSFVWIRGSFVYWDPSHKAWACVGDPTFVRDWNTIPKDVPRGTYMFPVLEASQSAEEQVAVFHDAVTRAGGLRPGIDLPPCLDVEFPGKGIAATGLDRAGVLNWIVRAVREMSRLFGVLPIVYTSDRVWSDTDADCLGNPPAPAIDLTRSLNDCPIWLARYPYKTRIQAVLPPPNGAPPVPAPWKNVGWAAWQDQGDAIGLPGMSSTVDIDEFNVIKSSDSANPLMNWYKKRASSIEALQKQAGLVVDGVAGVKTFCARAWL